MVALPTVSVIQISKFHTQNFLFSVTLLASANAGSKSLISMEIAGLRVIVMRCWAEALSKTVLVGLGLLITALHSLSPEFL